MPEEVYTTKEVADMLKLSRSTIIKLILNRKLSATVYGKQYRISEAQLQDYCKRNTIEPE